MTQSQLPKPIAQALYKQDVFLKALFDRPESLSALLPYDDYLPESGIFRQKDGSLGAVFEAKLVEHEGLSAEAIISQVEKLKSWFGLPTNCTLQVLFDQAYVSEKASEFSDADKLCPNPHPVSGLLFKRRLEAIQSACHGQSAWTPFRRRAFVSIRYYPRIRGAKISREFLKRSESILFHEVRDFIRESREFEQLLTSFRESSPVILEPLSAQELISILRRFFNPKSDFKRGFAPYNPNVSISEQLVYNQPTLGPDGIEREGIKTRSLSLKTAPERPYPGAMSYFLTLKFPFRLNLNVSFPSPRKVKTFYDIKEFFLQNSLSAGARRQKKDVEQVQERLAHGDRGIQVTVNVILEGLSDEELDSRTREVLNVFHRDLECEAIVEEDIGLGLCLNALPLAYAPQADLSSQRFIRMMRNDAVSLLPVFDSFRGMQEPLSLHLSREGNLVPYSCLNDRISNHAVYLGDSGSGKSSLILDNIESIKRRSPEPLVFVVDKKSSSAVLSEYYDGDFTVFDPNLDMPFSPFRGVFDEAKVGFLTKFLSSAIRMTSPSFAFESTHEVAISRALKLAYQRKAREAGLAYVEGEILKGQAYEQIEVLMEDVVVELTGLPSLKEFEGFGDGVDDLIQRLMPFYGEGHYAKYFRGSASQVPSKPGLLYVYDLDRLDSDPILQALITMAVFEEIRRIKSAPENAEREAVLLIEEIGLFGRNNPTAGQFIIDYAESGRKLSLWLWSATPRAANYFELEAGQAMWAVATHFHLLQMSPDNVRYLKSKSDLLDEPTAQIAASLRTVNGEYADVLYFNKAKTLLGAFRYLRTPFNTWMAPLNAKDARESAKARKRFKGQREKALEYLAAKYPNGIAAYEEANVGERGESDEGG